jgi:hypothetical protein
MRPLAGWSPRQAILNSTGAREPRHKLDPPVPVVARIEWKHDGEEHIETVALSWTGWPTRLHSPTGPAVPTYLGVARRGGRQVAVTARHDGPDRAIGWAVGASAAHRSGMPTGRSYRLRRGSDWLPDDP